MSGRALGAGAPETLVRGGAVSLPTDCEMLAVRGVR